jgi:heme oxygenase
MLTHLATQTEAHHACADGDRLAIMEQPTIERYGAFVGRIYCFEAPVEAACIATRGLPRGLLRTHFRAPRLAADLHALGLQPSTDRPATKLPFDSPAEALGWLWVLHRNTLLHGLIYRYLLGKLPDVMASAGNYLAAFEGRAGALMRELGDTLDATARRSAIAQQVVGAANDAFRLQRQWYSCDLLSPRRPPAPSRAPPQAA